MSDYGRLGPYELRGELGRGAMARVWRAWDPNLEREVAIKEPLFDPRLPEAVLAEMGKRFVGEGRAAARLSHPGIVTIYAADVWDGRPAIVMELIDGETLASRLRRGTMRPSEALATLDQLLSAVGYAHACGVVHRDIKPDNIFITSGGQVKLGDFGIAHVDGSMATMGTVAGSVLGTPGYMSPEQATGSSVDARSDLFSVGVVAYEMLSGRNPFGAGTGTDATTLLYRIVHEPAPELPASAAAGLPADLRPAVMRALEKNPYDRPQSAEEFRSMLHGYTPASQTGANVGRTYDSMAATNMDYGTVAATNMAYETTAAASRERGAHMARGGTSPRYDRQVPYDDGQSQQNAWQTGGSQQGYGQGSYGQGESDKPARPTWLPYALVAGVAALVLGFVLISALGSGGGGGGGGSTTTTPGQDTPAVEDATPTGSAYYLAVSDGRVAIFSNSSATPYEVTDVQVADLGSASAAELDAHVPADTIDEAEALVEAYRSEADSAREAAEKKAQEEAEEKARKEAEEKARQEAEEKARKEAEEKARQEAEEKARKEAEAAAASKSEAQLTVVGADGTSRTATIHRQGTSERVFADSNSRYLSASEVAALSDAERCIAWNEIIASSNGYAFKNSGLANYFAGCSWYYRNPGASSGGNLSDAGRANVELLQSYTDSWWKNLATY